LNQRAAWFAVTPVSFSDFPLRAKGQIMAAEADWRAQVELEAARTFGEISKVWMVKRNRRLANLTPAELAETPAGARVVLFEMRRARAFAGALRPKNVQS